MKPKDNKKPGWLYRTLAKEPVLISTVNPEVRCRKLESELFGNGYFHARVWSVMILVPGISAKPELLTSSNPVILSVIMKYPLNLLKMRLTV